MILTMTVLVLVNETKKEYAMNNPKRFPVRAITLAAAVLAFGATFHAQAAEPAKPMALQNVMEKLERDMQAATGAISREDWALVARLAPNIAHHAEPPVAERLRIMAWLGKDAGKFRGFDEQVHEAAAAMGEAATRGDGPAVITEFSKVQQSCLACHQAFRKSFQEHFYGQR
ncbi:conserved exported hypothetical protein [Thiomonas sp. CB3]|nr:conserved exported hypothetical protein [Thiomonas sp. CB3]CQR42370.1 conserved exported hypothetical protein [Thiomonas sp. CB3]CQR42980.1 conserved exported hypothetical protein [Thiomonas sp. CB3]